MSVDIYIRLAETSFASPTSVLQLTLQIAFPFIVCKNGVQRLEDERIGEGSDDFSNLAVYVCLGHTRLYGCFHAELKELECSEGDGGLLLRIGGLARKSLHCQRWSLVLVVAAGTADPCGTTAAAASLVNTPNQT